MIDSYNGVKKIIQDLYDEFLRDEKRISEIYENNSVRIDELDHKIHTLKKSEDVDFKVFSPRNSNNINSDKIGELENEKSILESESRNYSKQLRYYSDKVNKLNEVLIMLGETDIKEPLKGSAFVNVPDVVEEIIEDPFNDLFPSYVSKKNNTSSNNLFDNSIIKDTVTSNDDFEVNVEPEDDLKPHNDSSFNNDLFLKDNVNQIIHKAEFTERIITNDSLRAKLEIREIISLLKNLLSNVSRETLFK